MASFYFSHSAGATPITIPLSPGFRTKTALIGFEGAGASSGPPRGPRCMATMVIALHAAQRTTGAPSGYWSVTRHWEHCANAWPRSCEPGPPWPSRFALLAPPTIVSVSQIAQRTTVEETGQLSVTEHPAQLTWRVAGRAPGGGAFEAVGVRLTTWQRGQRTREALVGYINRQRQLPHMRCACPGGGLEVGAEEGAAARSAPGRIWAVKVEP